MSFDIKQVASNIKTQTVKHSPEILTGLGIAGYLTSIGLAVRATPLALDSIEAKKEELDVVRLKPSETVKATWKYYIPTVGLAAISTACIIGGQSINTKRNAALATAYGITEAAFTEYKNKVVETIGEKKEKEVQEQIYKDRVNAATSNENYICSTGFGDVLFLDFMSGRLFRSSINQVEKSFKELGDMISDDGYASLNDFYYENGLSACGLGLINGWKSDWLPQDQYGRVAFEPAFSTQRSVGGEPCLVIDFMVRPKGDFDKNA